MIYRFCRALLRFYFKLVFRLKGVNTENVPSHGPVVLCANHASNWDPPLLGCPIERDVHYMAKAELFNVPLLGQLLPHIKAFPVKRGGVSKESIRLAVQLLQSGNIIGVFPEGSRHNAGGMGKKGAVSLAFKANAAVVPAAIIGDYKPFRRMTIVYGKPVDLSEYKDNGSEGLEQATEKVLSVIRAMKEDYINGRQPV